MEYGGEDLRETEDDQGNTVFQAICEVSDLEALREGLEGGGFEVKEYGLTWLPSVQIPVQGEDASKLLNLIEALEDLDDTQNVFANFEISDEEMERLAGDREPITTARLRALSEEVAGRDLGAFFRLRVAAAGR